MGSSVLLPQYFLEGKIGHDSPPAIHWREFFYGFLGVTIAWQIVFLVISQNPARYRPMMLPSVLEKAGFIIAVVILFLQHRVSLVIVAPAGIDLLLGVLFFIAFVKTGIHQNS